MTEGYYMNECTMDECQRCGSFGKFGCYECTPVLDDQADEAKVFQQAIEAAEQRGYAAGIEAAAQAARAAAVELENIAESHPDDSPSRDRVHARGREALRIEEAIRALSTTPPAPVTVQEAARVLLRAFTSDDDPTNFKPSWEAFRDVLWKSDGSIYSAMSAFFRALAEQEENDTPTL
jgi:hypothetical protein